MADYDVVVVGAGNAALAAAVSAREQGARRVVVLEKAPRELRGGNTHYSGGLLRRPRCRAPAGRPSPVSTRAARWSAASSTATTRAAPG
jgi:glycine/D-amino acid oxidase-like deaminating enzyme